MLKNILFVLSTLAIARAQIPSLGWCPEYVPMTNFDMGKFLGVWYEAERYFQILDPVSRCVTANYTQGPDGKYHVSNEVTNRFTGIKRVLDGEIKAPATKAEEGKLHVKYTTVPLTPETQYAILETDYKSYAVLWSCTGIGLVNAQNAWVMTRERRADGATLQKAYGVLDKYKISRTFFIKTNQDDCAWTDDNASTPKPSGSTTVETPVQEEAAVVEQNAEKVVNMRSAIVPEEAPADDEKMVETPVVVPGEASETKPQEPESIEVPSKEVETVVDDLKQPPPVAEVPASSVPEIILKAAERAKDIAKKTIEEAQNFEPIGAIKEAFEKPVEKIQEAFEKPIENIQEALEKPVDQIKETFKKPIEQIKETFKKPLSQIVEVLNPPATENKEEFNEKEPSKQSEEKIVHEKEETNEKKIDS